MSENKWTPGPWVISSTGSIVTADGGYVAEAYDGLHNTNTDLDIAAANARLIAAAPALYDALKAALAYIKFSEFSSGMSGEVHDGMVEAMTAALSQAEGRDGEDSRG